MSTPDRLVRTTAANGQKESLSEQGNDDFQGDSYCKI